MNKKYKDPQFYELQKMRNSLSWCKAMSTLAKYLGCTNQFFNDWFNFQRRNKIIVKEELDHVLPVSRFGVMPEVCFHWVNIRPISKKENHQKMAKVDFELICKQRKFAKEFMGQYNFPNDTEKRSTINQFSNIWLLNFQSDFISERGSHSLNFSA